MMEQQEKHISDVLASIIQTFSPGISQLIRLISVTLEIDLLSYSIHVCLMLAMPTIFTFILPRTFKYLKPCFQIFISSTKIQYRNNLYPQVTKWMSTVEFYSWSSSTIAGTSESLNYYWDVDNTPDFVDTGNPAYHGKLLKVRYTPGHSCFHFFRYENCWFALYREPQHNSNDPLSRNAENIILYHFSWTKGALYSLMETIQKVNIDSRRGKVQIMSGYQNNKDVEWRTMCEENERELDSLALAQEMKDDIVSDIRRFFKKDVAESYKRRGVPYRRGYLLHGAPGTGKTSLCRALAAMFGLPIYILDLTTINSHGLRELFRLLPAGRCLVLLEDIDTAGIKREVMDPENIQVSSSSQRPNLGAVLNVMDGIGTKNGHIIVATTNVMPALDPALIRPGRIDRKYEFENPDMPTIADYFCHFFGDSDKNVAELAISFAEKIPHRSVTAATLQGYLLRCDDNPAKAVADVINLVPC